MTGSRTKIYLSRTIVTSIATMIMSLMMISILFVLGYYAYGLGDEVFVTVKNTFVPISMWCMNNLMITIVITSFSINYDSSAFTSYKKQWYKSISSLSMSARFINRH